MTNLILTAMLLVVFFLKVANDENREIVEEKSGKMLQDSDYSIRMSDNKEIKTSSIPP